MKLISKIVVMLILGVACGFGQCIVDQPVNNLPIEDENGTHWTIYDLADPENRVVVESDPSCMTQIISGLLLWTAELTYWSPVPAVGDSLIMIGSWDSAYVNNPGTYGSNQNHTGFYWLYSDIVDDVAATHWEDDTLRPIPKPIVTKTGPGAGANDTIWVTIPNPRETRYSGQTAYDVLGFWLWADTTFTDPGTPNAYNAGTAMDFGFIAVDGVYGENTVHWMLESDGFGAWHHWTTYFAYKIVVRPDTVDAPADTMGYSTYYFSQNSDAIDVYQNVVGIEENTQPRVQRLNLQALPNLFTDNTRIVFSITKPALVKLVVYNTSGQIIRTLVNDVKPAGEHHIEFDGTDTQGIELPAGIYFYQLQTSEQRLTGRLTKLR